MLLVVVVLAAGERRRFSYLLKKCSRRKAMAGREEEGGTSADVADSIVEAVQLSKPLYSFLLWFVLLRLFVWMRLPVSLHSIFLLRSFWPLEWQGPPEPECCIG